VWAEIGSDEALVKSMEAGKAFQDLENFFGKADKPKVDKEKKESKKKGPQMVNLLGKRDIHTHTHIYTGDRRAIYLDIGVVGI
jgi:hypothetical protein